MAENITGVVFIPITGDHGVISPLLIAGFLGPPCMTDSLDRQKPPNSLTVAFFLWENSQKRWCFFDCEKLQPNAYPVTTYGKWRFMGIPAPKKCCRSSWWWRASIRILLFCVDPIDSMEFQVTFFLPLYIQTPFEEVCVSPQTSPGLQHLLRGGKHLLLRYGEDLGCLGFMAEIRKCSGGHLHAFYALILLPRRRIRPWTFVGNACSLPYAWDRSIWI